MAANFRLSYRKDSAFRLGSGLGEVLLGSYITQQVIRSAQNRGGGPGGRSGGFSGRGLSGGGRSTVHRTGGRIHGGGSRKF